MINRAHFFTAIRASLFRGRLSKDQVTNTELIIDYALAQGASVQELAYMLATTYHETAHTMRPVEEYGKGKGHDYGKMLDIGQGPGHRVAYTEPPFIYYGRGFVQLTWLSNYRAAGRKLDIDLLWDPSLALKPEPAAQVLVRGMLEGWFTGKKLGDYFTPHKAEPVEARQVINGHDEDKLIAGYYATFLHALTC
jgi:hypothetical protein